jgi:hypothetical protein
LKIDTRGWLNAEIDHARARNAYMIEWGKVNAELLKMSTEDRLTRFTAEGWLARGAAVEAELARRGIFDPDEGVSE